MNSEIRMHDSVAPTEDITTRHFLTAAPLTLRRRRIGTVVMTCDDNAFDVEFADAQDRAFAPLPIATDKLPLLYDAPLATT
jgi:hypothetical protein